MDNNNQYMEYNGFKIPKVRFEKDASGRYILTSDELVIEDSKPCLKCFNSYSVFGYEFSLDVTDILAEFEYSIVGEETLCHINDEIFTAACKVINNGEFRCIPLLR